MNFMLIGRHGSGKTRLVKALSSLSDSGKRVFYDATKEDLISLCGMPNKDALTKGCFEFVSHERSIWDKEIVVVDELTRSGKESQNQWLEILEEKRCYGKLLPCKTLIATANPESYAAVNRLDEALLDRFCAVIPVPDHQAGTSLTAIEAMMEFAAEEKHEENADFRKTVQTLFDSIRAEKKRVSSDTRIMSIIRKYCASFTVQLLAILRERGESLYLSPRTYARHFPEVMTSVYSYFLATGEPDALKKSATIAWTYALATKLKLDPSTLEMINDTVLPLLSEAPVGERDTLRLEIGALSNLTSRIDFLKLEYNRISSNLDSDELEKFMAGVLKETLDTKDSESLLNLTLVAVKFRKGHEELVRRIEGRLILTLNSAVSCAITQLRKAGGLASKEEKETILTIQECVDLEHFLKESGLEFDRFRRHLLRVFDGKEKLNPILLAVSTTACSQKAA